MKSIEEKSNSEKAGRALINACKRNNVKKLEYLLIKRKYDIHYDNDEILMVACCEGSLDAVDFLLTSPKLTERIDVHAKNSNALICAVYDGYLNIVKYLLTSPKLKKHTLINAQDDLAFIYACEHSSLDIIEYLYKSEDLIEHANPYAQDSRAFKSVYCFNDVNTMSFLVKDMGIELSESFLKWTQSQEKNNVSIFLNTYKLKESLDKNLSGNKQDKIKMKI